MSDRRDLKCASVGPLGNRCEHVAGHTGDHRSSMPGSHLGGVSWPRRSGAVQARVDAVRSLVAMASGEWSDPAKRPSEEPYGTCYWDDVESGECDNLATAWRWVEEHGGWGPVCEAHREVPR